MKLVKRLKNVNLEYYLLGLILIFALFLRVYALGTPPLWIDESISAVASKSIINHGFPYLIQELVMEGLIFFII